MSSSSTAVALRREQPTASSKATPDLPDRFAAIGAYGFRPVQTAILAALVTEDPLLLIGPSGTGKTHLLNSISAALGLEHRHYNASLIAFDDLVGFPYPDDERRSVRYLQTPATVWGAESMLVDEISRCKPEHQNRLFSLVHERRLQGIALERLRFRWAAMNPCRGDQSGGGEYLGSEPLDPALADRFALIVAVGDWDQLSEEQQRQVADPGNEGLATGDGGCLRDDISAWRERFLAQLRRCPTSVTEYARIATTEAAVAGYRVSPRRARLLVRSLLAAAIVESGRPAEATFRAILECSLPHPAWGEQPAPAKVHTVHRLAWEGSRAEGAERWLHAFLRRVSLRARVRLLAETCPSPDIGSLAVEQLLAQAPRDQAAAFALAVYPAALAGALPVGAEGLADLGRLAGELLEVDGELAWSTHLREHPELTRLAKALDPLEPPARKQRARQLFYWAVLNNVRIARPGAFEAEFHATVEYLAGRAAA